jgi:hypothetical protein
MPLIRDYHGFGHIPDDDDPRDFEATFAAGTELPSSANLGELACNILDQGPSSACVGFASAQAIFVAQGAAGVASRILPNPLVPYGQARRLKKGRDHVLCDAVDLGCAPRYAWQGLRDGIVSTADYPIALAKVDDEIPWDAFRRAVDRSWLRFERIVETGWDRVDAIKRALAAGHPVCFGTVCDQGFLDWRGGTAWRRTGPSKGRHYLCATGYLDDTIVGPNSYGRGWGVNGFFAFAAEQLASADIADVYVPTIDMGKL